MGPSDADVLGWFEPQQVADKDVPLLDGLRTAYALTASAVLNTVPPSAHRTAALRDLLNASQSAVFALTHAPKETLR